MDRPWLIRDISESSVTDSVIVIVKSKQQRRQIVDNLGKLGDRVIDYYSQTQMYSVADLFGIPHRLMVMHYPDYYKNKEAIAKYLTVHGTFDFPPILIYGRWWRKIPSHPAVIDGDDTTPEALYRMYWEARGASFDGFRKDLICF